jgi:hypothetical protein
LKFKVKNHADATLQLSIDQALINFLKLYKKAANNQFEFTELGEHYRFIKEFINTQSIFLI